MDKAGSRPPERLTKLSVIIPARDEQDCIATTVEYLSAELRRNQVPSEICELGSVERVALRRF